MSYSPEQSPRTRFYQAAYDAIDGYREVMRTPAEFSEAEQHTRWLMCVVSAQVLVNSPERADTPEIAWSEFLTSELELPEGSIDPAMRRYEERMVDSHLVVSEGMTAEEMVIALVDGADPRVGIDIDPEPASA